MSTRLVLMPHGQPADVEHRTTCLELVRRCGGHWGKLIDAPAATLEAFGNHVRRVKAIHGPLAPLVVLSRTTPLALEVVAARRTLEKIVPTLHQAAWLVVPDPAGDPTFRHEAEAMGVFDGEFDDAPIWTSPGGLHFLVLTAGVQGNLAERVVELLGRASLPPDRGALTW